MRSSAILFPVGHEEWFSTNTPTGLLEVPALIGTAVRDCVVLLVLLDSREFLWNSFWDRQPIQT